MRKRKKQKKREKGKTERKYLYFNNEYCFPQGNEN